MKFLKWLESIGIATFSGSISKVSGFYVLFPIRNKWCCKNVKTFEEKKPAKSSDNENN